MLTVGVHEQCVCIKVQLGFHGDDTTVKGMWLLLRMIGGYNLKCVEVVGI